MNGRREVSRLDPPPGAVALDAGAAPSERLDATTKTQATSALAN